MKFDAASMPIGVSLACPALVDESKFWRDTDAVLVAASGAALSPRRATYFSLLRQRKLKKRKATLVPASLRFAAGNLQCSVQPGSRSNSPAAQTIAGPFPSFPSLLGAFTRVCETGAGSGFDRTVATNSIASCARITKARGRKHLRKRRVAWFLGSDRNFAAQHPQGKPKAWRIWALASKTPDPASEPKPALALEKSESPAAATERRRNSSTNLVFDATQGFDTLSPNG